ncbi:MAG: hypothetical protein WBF06_11700 [Candidatus Acidiferrales bacterium]
MTLRCLCWAAVAALLIPCAARAQDASPPPTPARAAHTPFAGVPPPAVPDDPLELVTGEAQPANDAEQRADAMNLLRNAQNLSNLRAHPYDLNTIFTSVDATGASSEWVLEDISPARDIYRWSAEGPSFSGIFLSKGDLLSSNRPTNAVPLRLAQVRDAIFFAYTWVHQHASVRMATGTLNGVELQCVLVAHDVGTHTPTGARNWDEYEYCVDPNTGLLATYSPVPGIYYHYDYASAIHFHDKIIPDEFTISEGGRTVVDARTLSVTDPVGADSALFSGDGLKALGVGPSTWGAAIYSVLAPMQSMAPLNVNSALSLQIVVVAGITGSDGQLAESEILTTTAAGLNEAALDRANKVAAMQCGCGPGTAPGAIAPSHEVIYVIHFFTNAT